MSEEDRLQILSPSSSECSDFTLHSENTDFPPIPLLPTSLPQGTRKLYTKKKPSRLLRRSMTVHSPIEMCSDMETVNLTSKSDGLNMTASPSRTSRLADGVRRSLRRPLRSISFSGRRTAQDRRNSYGRSVSSKNHADSSLLIAFQSLGELWLPCQAAFHNCIMYNYYIGELLRWGSLTICTWKI